MEEARDHGELVAMAREQFEVARQFVVAARCPGHEGLRVEAERRAHEHHPDGRGGRRSLSRDCCADPTHRLEQRQGDRDT